MQETLVLSFCFEWCSWTRWKRSNRWMHFKELFSPPEHPCRIIESEFRSSCSLLWNHEALRYFFSQNGPQKCNQSTIVIHTDKMEFGFLEGQTSQRQNCGTSSRTSSRRDLKSWFMRAETKSMNDLNSIGLKLTVHNLKTSDHTRAVTQKLIYFGYNNRFHSKIASNSSKGTSFLSNRWL